MGRHSPELDGVKRECLNLLIVFLSYRESLAQFAIKDASHMDLVRWWTQLRVFENDLILRLCRLVDKDTRSHSVGQALKSVRRQIPENEARALDKELAEYRDLIHPLKMKARNYFIAHLSKAVTQVMDPKGGLADEIAAAVNLIDRLCGEPVNYVLKTGTTSLTIDLKRELAASGVELPR